MLSSISAWLWVAAGYVVLLCGCVIGARLSNPATEPAKKPRALRRAAVARFGGLLAAATLVYAAVILLTGSRAPLGMPLPAVPRLVTTKGVGFGEESVIKLRMPADELKYLAPQPDGWPPLRFDYHCEYVDFTIWHPLGSTVMTLGAESVVKDSVLAIVDFKMDYPLTRITYSAPMHKPDERLTVYVSRLRWELERKGAQFYSNTDPLLLPDYRFEHFELQMKDDQGKLASHFMFFGPYGNHALTIDFATTPEQHELCRPLVMKIMRSFKPGALVKDMMKREWPDYVGPPPAR